VPTTRGMPSPLPTTTPSSRISARARGVGETGHDRSPRGAERRVAAGSAQLHSQMLRHPGAGPNLPSQPAHRPYRLEPFPRRRGGGETAHHQHPTPPPEIDLRDGRVHRLGHGTRSVAADHHRLLRRGVGPQVRRRLPADRRESLVSRGVSRLRDQAGRRPRQYGGNHDERPSSGLFRGRLDSRSRRRSHRRRRPDQGLGRLVEGRASKGAGLLRQHPVHPSRRQEPRGDCPGDAAAPRRRPRRSCHGQGGMGDRGHSGDRDRGPPLSGRPARKGRSPSSRGRGDPTGARGRRPHLRDPGHDGKHEFRRPISAGSGSARRQRDQARVVALP